MIRGRVCYSGADEDNTENWYRLACAIIRRAILDEQINPAKTKKPYARRVLVRNQEDARSFLDALRSAQANPG
jgi:hypothetical protein